MDEKIYTAAFMVWVSSAWLHLSFPPFRACILQSEVVEIRGFEKHVPTLQDRDKRLQC